MAIKAEPKTPKKLKIPARMSYCPYTQVYKVDRLRTDNDIDSTGNFSGQKFITSLVNEAYEALLKRESKKGATTK